MNFNSMNFLKMDSWDQFIRKLAIFPVIFALLPFLSLVIPLFLVLYLPYQMDDSLGIEYFFQGFWFAISRNGITLPLILLFLLLDYGLLVWILLNQRKYLDRLHSFALKALDYFIKLHFACFLFLFLLSIVNSLFLADYPFTQFSGWMVYFYLGSLLVLSILMKQKLTQQGRFLKN